MATPQQQTPTQALSAAMRSLVEYWRLTLRRRATYRDADDARARLGATVATMRERDVPEFIRTPLASRRAAAQRVEASGDGPLGNWAEVRRARQEMRAADLALGAWAKGLDRPGTEPNAAREALEAAEAEVRRLEAARDACRVTLRTAAATFRPPGAEGYATGPPMPPPAARPPAVAARGSAGGAGGTEQPPASKPATPRPMFFPAEPDPADADGPAATPPVRKGANRAAATGPAGPGGKRGAAPTRPMFFPPGSEPAGTGGNGVVGPGDGAGDRMPSDVHELVGTAEFFAVPPQPRPGADLRADAQRRGGVLGPVRGPAGVGPAGAAAAAASRPRPAPTGPPPRGGTVASLIRLAATPDERREGPLRFLRPVAAALVLAFILGAAVALPAGALANRRIEAAAKGLPNLDDLQLLWQSQRTEVYDRRGKLIASLVGDEDRIVIPYADMPETIRNAVIAAEDQRFYQHHGVDQQGILRAAVRNAAAGETEEGGSTITQQYVRSSYPDLKDDTVLRKVKEAALAAQVEKRMSKEEILAGYLNRVYFGGGYYGIEAASRGYFRHPAKELNLEEAATLAAILRAPEGVNPRSKDKKDRERARQLRDTVLLQMAGLGMVSQAEADAARKTPLRVEQRQPKRNKRYNHFVDYVINQLVGEEPTDDSRDALAKSNNTGDRRLGRTYAERHRNLFEGGLVIHTTLDSEMQRAAQAAVSENIPATSKANGGNRVDAGLDAIDPRTGEIMAMVGSRDYNRESFNLAAQAKRSPGSTFKGFVLAAALEEGISPESGWLSTGIGPNETICGDPTWKPGNYAEGKDAGVISLRKATAASTNGVFARVMGKLCPRKVAAVAARLGVHIPKSDWSAPAIALGGTSVSVLEMASGYATFAANGIYRKPIAVTKITRRNGDVVLENKTRGKEAMEPILAYEETKVLQGVIQGGTASANGQIGRPSAGKTGTAQAYGDAWFVGYTPQLSAAVWVGNPNNNQTFSLYGNTRVTGGSYPTMIWRDFMINALRDKPILDFERPPGEPEYTFNVPPPAPTTTIPGQPGPPGGPGGPGGPGPTFPGPTLPGGTEPTLPTVTRPVITKPPPGTRR
jgi:penicillin-binding protein 1A